jgi:rubrerythrin
MKIECVTCGKVSEDKKMYFELSAKTGPRNICRDCAAELGINNFMSAGFHSNTGVLKKYVKIHPEAQIRLDEQLKRLGEYKEEIHKELSQMNKNTRNHSGCKKKKQVKCVCKSCGNVYYFGWGDVITDVYNLVNFNIYTANQIKDHKQCPKCGSRATEQKTAYFWVDKNGNCVDVEE